MKFSNSDVQNLNSIFNVCALGNIDMLTISANEAGNKFLSGVNKDASCCFFASENIPQLEPNTKLSIKKVKLLKQRFDLFKNDDKLSIELKTKANGDVNELVFKGSKANSSYKPAPSSAVKCPAAVEDVATKNITLTKDEIDFIINAGKAMNAGKITFQIKDKTTTVIFTDSNKDTFSVDLETPAENVDENSPKNCMSFLYTDVFFPIVKAASLESDTVLVTIFEASAEIKIGQYSLILISPMDDA